MSSRREAASAAAAVPLKPSSAPLVLPMNRAVPFRSSIKINAMRPPTAHSDRNEVSSRVVITSKTSGLVSRDLSNKMSSKSSSSGVTSSKPLWQTVKSFGGRLDRVAPSNKQGKEKNNKQEQMATSTGTESSGVFSSSENGSLKELNKDVVTSNRILRPPQSSTSRLTAAMAKTTSRLVKRPTPTVTSTVVDQTVELHNQIHLLKIQHHEQLEQLKREHNDKFQKEMTIALAEKENQFQQQLETKEAAWTAEWTARLVDERAELERQLAEERAARAEAAEAAASSLAEERKSWQQKIDALLEKTRGLLAEKERLEKNFRQEVEVQVQATVCEYNELQKETTSLQAVLDLRCEEVRNLRSELEKTNNVAKEVPYLRERVTTLGNMVEGLKAQLEQKNQEERRLQSEVKRLEASYKEEATLVQRLSMYNEQLRYKLQSLPRRPSPTHSLNDCDRTSPTKSHNQSSPFSSTPSETPRLSRRGLPSPTLSPIISENGSGENNNNSIASLTPDGGGTGQIKRRRDAVVSSGNGHGRRASVQSDVDDVFGANTSTEMASELSEAAAEAGGDAELPTVRDFTKKHDSVSYVLDLGGENSPSGSAGMLPLSATYHLVPPSSPWMSRRNSGLVRSASLRYPPNRPFNAHN
ncbi:rho-associated protein kinase 1-like isoform X2 [Daphnia carinata]|uniref:rho-associated protein kinase 1-like isoform X2 n=1 Tax=Daphnia carinata TaxID=120202 RepID=UPI0025794F3F|nr:rho-associated protein kinase 1-like isoform X2 [Daphnia carinata]